MIEAITACFEGVIEVGGDERGFRSGVEEMDNVEEDERNYKDEAKMRITDEGRHDAVDVGARFWTVKLNKQSGAKGWEGRLLESE